MREYIYIYIGLSNRKLISILEQLFLGQYYFTEIDNIYLSIRKLIYILKQILIGCWVDRFLANHNIYTT